MSLSMKVVRRKTGIFNEEMEMWDEFLDVMSRRL